MNCCVCGNEINWFSGVRVHSGRLCKSCSGRLPSLLLQKGQCLKKYTLMSAMQKTATNLERFSATASFGHLHIDEVHGLFCVAKALNFEGKPVKGNNVFSMYDLVEVGLTCSSPREIRNTVRVDVEFKCSLVNPAVSFTQTVKRGCRCKSKLTNERNFTWEEPSDFQMFQTLLSRALTGAWERVNEVLCGKEVYDFELEKARAVFMLQENFTKDELEIAYSRMKNVYDIGVPNGVENREMIILNKYYCFLQSYMERKPVARSKKGEILF